MRSAHHPARDEIDLIAVMAALADPIRLGLVRVLSDGIERGWGELDAPVANSTLSHHLRVLRSAGITRTRQEGTRCFVELRRDDLDARLPGLIDSILEAAARHEVGSAVSVRTTISAPPP